MNSRAVLTESPTRPPIHRSGESWYRRIAFVVFFASGFAALLYQVVWQRLLVFFSGSDVYSVTLIVTAFMAGLGVGNLVGGHLADRLSRGLNLIMFVIAELAIMGFGLLSKGFFYDFLYTRHAELAQSGGVLWTILFLSLLWPTFFMGVSLPMLAKALTSNILAAAPTIGGLYGANTLGAATGAFITSWVLLPNFGLHHTLSLGVTINFACALTLLLLVRFVADRFTGNESEKYPTPAELAEPAGFNFGIWFLLYFL